MAAVPVRWLLCQPVSGLCIAEGNQPLVIVKPPACGGDGVRSVLGAAAGRVPGARRVCRARHAAWERSFAESGRLAENRPLRSQSSPRKPRAPAAGALGGIASLCTSHGYFYPSVLLVICRLLCVVSGAAAEAVQGLLQPGVLGLMPISTDCVCPLGMRA